MNIKSRLEALEKRLAVLEEENIIFVKIVDGDRDRDMTIHDMKRGRSANNKELLPIDDFLRITGEEWGIDLLSDYHGSETIEVK